MCAQVVQINIHSDRDYSNYHQLNQLSSWRCTSSKYAGGEWLGFSAAQHALGFAEQAMIRG